MSNFLLKFKKKIRDISFIYGLFKGAKFFKNQLFINHPKLLISERKIFTKIVPYLSTIFDVGARYDTDYIDISQGRSINYHLFEINPKFFKLLKKNASKFKKEKIFLNNFGVGNEEGEVSYYLNSESVLNNFSNKFESLFTKKLRIKTLKNYIRENSITKVDFLKTDIEGFDYFALLGIGDYLLNINFVQFELGIGAPLKNKLVKGEDYLSLFKGKFSFFLICDEVNPIFNKINDKVDLISFGKEDIDHITKIQSTGIGFNVLAIRNDFNISNIDFSIDKYNAYLYDKELIKQIF